MVASAAGLHGGLTAAMLPQGLVPAAIRMQCCLLRHYQGAASTPLSPPAHRLPCEGIPSRAYCAETPAQDLWRRSAHVSSAAVSTYLLRTGVSKLQTAPASLQSLHVGSPESGWGRISSHFIRRLSLGGAFGRYRLFASLLLVDVGMLRLTSHARDDRLRPFGAAGCMGAVGLDIAAGW